MRRNGFLAVLLVLLVGSLFVGKVMADSGPGIPYLAIWPDSQQRWKITVRNFPPTIGCLVIMAPGYYTELLLDEQGDVVVGDLPRNGSLSLKVAPEARISYWVGKFARGSFPLRIFYWQVDGLEGDGKDAILVAGGTVRTGLETAFLWCYPSVSRVSIETSGNIWVWPFGASPEWVPYYGEPLRDGFLFEVREASPLYRLYIPLVGKNWSLLQPQPPTPTYTHMPPSPTFTRMPSTPTATNTPSPIAIWTVVPPPTDTALPPPPS